MPTVTHGCDDSGLSTAKPANPNEGHKFWCTDTLELLVYDAGTSAWKTAAPAENAYLDGVTPGTGAASKAVVLGAGGNFLVPSGAVFSTSTVGGMQISGAPAQKLAVFGETPVAQYSTAGTTTGFTASTGTAVQHTSTFTGGTGSIAYTIGDMVNALKQFGILDS